MTYDPVPYWRERGETYMAKFRAERYTEQEEALVQLLGRLEFTSVLEVGCGFGRIASLVRRVNPKASYMGLDLSPTMIAAARDRLGTAAGLVTGSILDFKMTVRWDLVIAVEVLMHIPPGDIATAVRKLDRLAARHIVTLDWTTPVPGKRPAAHNFLHPYAGLLGTGPFGRTREVEIIPIGQQTIYHVEKTR